MGMWSRGTADTGSNAQTGSGDQRAAGWKLQEAYVIGLGNWGRSPMGESV